MNFSFNKDLLGLDDKPAAGADGKPQDMGQLLALTLVNQGKGDSIKYLEWARSLYNCKPLNLDKSDKKTLRDFIDVSETLTVLAKGQMLEVIDAATE